MTTQASYAPAMRCAGEMGAFSQPCFVVGGPAAMAHV